MVLVLVLVSVTPLILITGLMGYYFETSYRENIVENLDQRVGSHQQRINSFLDETFGTMKSLADSSSYEELLNNAYLQDRLRVLQDAYPGVFDDLGIIDAAGVQISYAGTLNLLNADYSHAAWFRDAVMKNYSLSDVFLGLRNKPHFIICIRKKRGNSDWFLRGTVNFATFSSLVDELRVGKTGSALIVNREGRLQSQPRTILIVDLPGLMKNTPWAGRKEPSVPESGAPIVPKVKIHSSGKNAMTGLVEGPNGSILLILMPLKSGEWTLVYQQVQDDAFSEVSRARAIALTIFFSGCLSVLLVTLFVSRQMVGRIERADLAKERMNEQMTETRKLASIGELAAGVAHEINNPVAIMLEHAGWMEDLIQEEELQKSRNLDEFKRSLKQIGLQGVRCKEITHKLLSFARRTDSVHHKIQLNETLEEILRTYEASSKFGGIRLHTDLDRDLPLVLASPTEMHEVFVNLIDNALDAMSSAGGNLEIRSRAEGNDVVVDIADTGHAISEIVMPRIFDPFFTTKPAGQGTGLGLSICYGIIKKLGGNLAVDSTSGVGTTFHVHIPIREEKA